MDNHIRQTFTNQIWMNNLSINCNDIKLLWLPLLASKLPLTSQKHFALCACKETLMFKMCAKCKCDGVRLNSFGCHAPLFKMVPTFLPTLSITCKYCCCFQNGFLSALPYLCMWIFAVVGSQGADYMRSKGYWTTTKTRKIMNTFGKWMTFYFCIIVLSSGSPFAPFFWWFLSFNENWLDKQVCSIGQTRIRTKRVDKTNISFVVSSFSK